MNKEKVATEIVINWKDLSFDQRASRAELFVRMVWGFLYGIVAIVYSLVFIVIISVFGVVAGILMSLQWIVILIAGRRWETAFSWAAKFYYQRTVPYMIRLWNYELRFMAYFLWMTDKKPSLGFNDKNSDYFKQL